MSLSVLLILLSSLSPPVNGWALDLSGFGSCTVHVALLNNSQTHLDWSSNIISTNPHMLWTISTQGPVPKSVELSIHSKRSLCTVNLLLIADEEREEEQLSHYAGITLNNLRPSMHSTFIAIREQQHNNRAPSLNGKIVYNKQSFRLLFAVISRDEESLEFYYFCPVCNNPMKRVHNDALSTVCPKHFRADWSRLVVGISGILTRGLSDKQCQQNPSQTDCLAFATMELLSHALNFTIFYAKSIESACMVEGGCIVTALLENSYSPNVPVPFEWIMQTWYFKYRGVSLFYCIPRNVTNMLQQGGIQTWVLVFETKFWVASIIFLIFATLLCSPSLEPIRPVEFAKSFGRKCFYIFCALTRQEIPPDQKAILTFSFVISLVLYVYENEFTAYVIVEKEPPPYRSSGEVVADNYTVLLHVDRVLFDGDLNGIEELYAEKILNQMLNKGFLKERQQFEVRGLETNGTILSVITAMLKEQIRSALFEKVAVWDRLGELVSPLPIIAEWTHIMNWMKSHSVCYVTESDVVINPILWITIVHFKFEVLKTVNVVEQSGLENYWRYRFLQNEANVLKKASRTGEVLGLSLEPHNRESGLVSMKQLWSMVMLCLGLMGLGSLIFLLEVLIGRKTKEEIVTFFDHLFCQIWALCVRVVIWGQMLEIGWRRRVSKSRNKHTVIVQVKSSDTK